MNLRAIKNMSKGQKSSGKLLIGFFTLMLALTIVSRGLNGMVVPRVSVARPFRGEIRQSVNFSGTVEAGGTLPLNVEAGYRIQSLAEEGTSLKEGDIAAVLDIDELNRALKEAQRELEKARLNAELNSIEEKPAGDDAVALAQLALDRAQEDLKLASKKEDINLNRASAELTRVYKEYKELRNDGLDSEDEAIIAIKNQIKQLQNTLDDAELSAQQSKITSQRSVDDAKYALEQKKQEEEKRVNSLSADQRKKVIQARISAMELEDHTEKVAKIQALIDNGGKITVPASAVVTKVNAAAGDTTAGGALMLLSDAGMGSRIKVSLPWDKAKHLNRNDYVEIYAANAREVISGIITSVKQGEKKSEDSEITIIIPDKTLEPGTSVQIRCERKGETYNMIIPLSALHSKNNSTSSGYVLVVRESSTITGIQQVAESVPVQILEQNADYAAIQGVFDADDKIISATSRSISAGDSVRVESSQ